VRFANIDGRACLVHGGEYFDLASASHGLFGPDVTSAYQNWQQLVAWFSSAFDPVGLTPTTGVLRAPVPAPSQAFGIGLNYADHAEEAKLELPQTPMVFPKFTSCIAGPSDPLELDCDTVDWEVELVVAIGRACRHVSVDDAWGYVAGLTVGQDISDRTLQFSDASAPQFGLGKSKSGYGPIGPVVVTPDELEDRMALAIECSLNGELMQRSNTRELIFDVPTLVSYLSTIVTLRPGDVIFTGTPSGIGMVRTPPRYLRDGDVLVSEISGIGRLDTTITKSNDS
jgi:2,4-diketo-3-deoxy-L-fuconate hydrolase